VLSLAVAVSLKLGSRQATSPTRLMAWPAAANGECFNGEFNME
jgi:hypothetical protein